MMSCDNEDGDIFTWAEAGVAALALCLLAPAARCRRRRQRPSVALPDSATAWVCAGRPDTPGAPLTMIWRLDGQSDYSKHHQCCLQWSNSAYSCHNPCRNSTLSAVAQACFMFEELGGCWICIFNLEDYNEVQVSGLHLR